MSVDRTRWWYRVNTSRSLSPRCETGMTLTDYRDHDISGATAAARDAFERALDAHLSWRAGAEGHLDHAVSEAPEFTMAHVLRAYLRLCSRDVVRVQQARAAYAQAAA